MSSSPIFGYFSKVVEKIQISSKFYKNKHFKSYLAEFFLEWGKCQTKVVEKIKIQILCPIMFFENRALYETMWKIMYSRAGHR